MERYSAARPQTFVYEPLVLPTVGIPATRSQESRLVSEREIVSAPIVSSGDINLPTLHAGRGQKPAIPGRYDHLRARYDEPLKRLESLRQRLHPAPLDKSLREPRYPTRWRATVTLEKLLTDTQVRKVAFAKARSLGYTDQDAEDCIQLGSINLWKALQKQPTLLSDKGPAWVGIWIALSGSRRALWKHEARAVSLDDPNLDWQAVDERLLLYQRSRKERWATWATRVDERIDFELLMRTLAERYEHDYLKLLALYSLTTSVKMRDVATLVGIDKKRFAGVVSNAVKDDIRALLEVDAEAHVSDEYWTDQLQRGENLECVTRVAERVMDNQRLLLALYIVTTSATRKDVADLFEIGLTAFRKDITHIKTLLAEEFRKVKRE
jgi:hypothetical protein